MRFKRKTGQDIALKAADQKGFLLKVVKKNEEGHKKGSGTFQKKKKKKKKQKKKNLRIRKNWPT